MRCDLLRVVRITAAAGLAASLTIVPAQAAGAIPLGSEHAVWGADRESIAERMEVDAGGSANEGLAAPSELSAAGIGSLPVHRFRYYGGTPWRDGAYFYTADPAERDSMISSSFQYEYDGIVWNASGTWAAPFTNGLSRYLVRESITYFYTADSAEGYWVEANLGYRFQGIDYYVASIPGAGLAPVWHFYMPRIGTHFYTISDAEAYDALTNGTGEFEYDCLAFYADPTGVTGASDPYDYPPVAFEDYYDFAGALDVDAVDGVLSNDVDVDSSVVTATVVTTPQHGTLTFNTDGSFRYVPDAGFAGMDRFTYRTSSGSASEDVATAYLDGPPVYKTVYRFYNRAAGVHFYTASEVERDDVIARLSGIYNFEGPSYSVNTNSSRAIHPVYRFYNLRKGVHFYTASEEEKDNVVRTMSGTYRLEGVSYYVSKNDMDTPVYRFYNHITGVHLYTSSEVEAQDVIDRLSDTYNFEGVAYYVP